MPTTTSSGSCWDYFPLKICINVKDRADRLAECTEEFKRVGLHDVCFYRAERSKEGGMQGGFDSHIACLEYAVARNVPYVLMFEDDVLFLEGWEESMRRVLQFLQSRQDWNIFYLGGFIFRKVGMVTDHILQCAPLCAHGYVMKTEFARKIIPLRPAAKLAKLISIDVFYAIMNQNNSFVHINPQVAIQRPSVSDGNWDKRALNPSGWLGKAMIYSSLDFRGRMRSDLFPFVEKIRIQNGLNFFKAFRVFLKFKLNGQYKRGEKAAGPFAGGEFVGPDNQPLNP